MQTQLIGINNRNLKTLKTDLATTAELAPHVPSDRFLVAESGIRSHVDIRRLSDAGARCFLVGESLLRQPDVAAATRTLLDTAPPPVSLTHFDAQGRAHMVDVGDKPETGRTATARVLVLMQPATRHLVESGTAGKGDVLGVARIAGIMAAKRTSELVPLCHPLPIAAVALELTVVDAGVEIAASVRTMGRTGVEMEALTAASVAALTVYDMLKAVDRGMRIDGLRVVHKDGGASGRFEQA